MIYITGDCHGNFERFNKSIFPEQDDTVDFIVSHCCASSTLALLSNGTYKPDILTAYFEELRQKVKFKK